MLKKLLSGLSMTALLFTACKKQEDVTSNTANNTRTLIQNQVEPTPALSPVVFFVDPSQEVVNTATLFQVKNLLDAKPIVSKLFTSTNGGFNNFTNGKQWAFNTNTSEITTLATLSSLNKFATAGFSFSSLSTQGKSCHSHIRINGAKNEFYCIGGTINGSILKGNLNDMNNVQEIFSRNDGSIRITAMDVDPVNNKIYFADAISKAIYVMNTNGTNKTFLATIPWSESVESGATPFIRVDASKNKLFISTRSISGLPKKLNLWSLSTSGINWKNIMEIPDETGSFFSFDILPGSSIFFSYYQPSSNKCIVNRIGMDGFGSIPVYTGFKVKSVVVAMVNGNN